MKKPAIAIEKYGCTLNQADTDSIRAILCGLGFRVLSPDEIEDADVIILNTCTVKGATENKIIARIRKIESARLGTQDTRLVISGCMSVNSAKLRKFTSAPIVWPGAIARIGDAVEDALTDQVTEYKERSDKENLPRIFTTPILRIPIVEGCTGSCTFCQTKFARPGLKSVNPARLLEWINDGVARGAKEIELTAMDTGAYGLDIKTDLVSLLNCINDIEGDFLVRLGMINPEHVLRMKEGLITAFKKEKIYRFLHLPVQSGSENVVKEMGRKHTVSEFVELVREFRDEIPDISISTDIIVGYPTETEEDFLETLGLIKRMGLDMVNLSKFSPRPGTAAKELPQLHNDEIKRRSVEASKVVRRICEEQNEQYIGKTLDVLITEKQKGFTGRTKNYKQVVARGYDGKLGEWIKARITETNRGSLFGKVV